MMMQFIVCAAALLAVVGCGEENADELWARAEGAAADPAALDQAVEAYSAFVARFAQDERAATALKNWAAIEQQKGDLRGAIALYERLIKEYPQSQHGDEAQFMIAFVYEEYLEEPDLARSAYQLVIDRYPNSELAASAKQLLPHVGRNPEEWVHFQDRAQ